MYLEASTPVTIEHFTGHPCGAVYGLKGTKERVAAPWLEPGTPVVNLYLAGSDISTSGVMGAMMGGVICVTRIIGIFGFPIVFGHAYAIYFVTCVRKLCVIHTYAIACAFVLLLSAIYTFY